MPAIPTYAIVGAGFSGIAVAVALLRRLQSPARVCLINRNHRFGRGMAYGTRSGSHLLNVPAGRMSLTPGDDGEFLRFLQAEGLPYRGGDFVPRKLYGDYLEATLERAQARAAEGVRLELVQAEVLRMDMRGDGVDLRLGDGRTLNASEVILALGNFAPRPPCSGSAAWGSAAVANDPWAAAALDHLPPQARVLLTGSGLTAFDVVLALLDRGHVGPITLMSRRGLLPRSHREQETPPAAGLVAADAMSALREPRAMLRALRRMIRDAEAQGHDWRDVIGGLRAQTPRLWGQLSEAGRRQFMRHLLPYWDTHRHRAAPDIHRRIQDALARGQLRVIAGRLFAIEPAGGGPVGVRWRARGKRQVTESQFDAVINCTGPSCDLRYVNDPLIDQFRSEGLLRIDSLALGLEVDRQYRLLRRDGAPLDHVRYVGPLLRAQLWEATAVPELRAHAAHVVEALVPQEAEVNLA